MSLMKQKIPSPSRKTRLEEDRLAELLDVAAEVFLAEGFAGASTNEIARRANSSKETFYSRFPNKESLFTAVIERRMKSVLEEVTTLLPREAPMEDTLREFGSRFLRTVLSEKQIRLIRLISMESSRFPALGELFFQLGPKRGQAFLADYLAGQVQQHRLRDGDTARMAEHYMSLLSGGAVRWIILGLRRVPLRRDKLEEHLEAALQAFLNAYVHKA
jgi:TetR/AcrR family transcriptional regulator, mexJK operon transcriptional repressor